MKQTVTKAGKNVKTKIDHHKPAAFGGKGYPPTGPKPLVCVPVQDALDHGGTVDQRNKLARGEDLEVALRCWRGQGCDRYWMIPLQTTLSPSYEKPGTGK